MAMQKYTDIIEPLICELICNGVSAGGDCDENCVAILTVPDTQNENKKRIKINYKWHWLYFFPVGIVVKLFV